MTKQIIAIGGGGFGRDLGKELLKTTFLSRPKLRNQIFVLYLLLQVIMRNTKKTITQPFQNLIAIQLTWIFFKRTPDLERLN